MPREAVARARASAAPRLSRARPTGDRAVRRAPQHYYLVRSVDPVDPAAAVPHADLHHRRAGHSAKPRIVRCCSAHGIDVIVAKNSGGAATYGKIAAARALGIDVIMLRRPPLPDVPAVETVEAAVALLDHALASTAARGV